MTYNLLLTNAGVLEKAHSSSRYESQAAYQKDLLSDCFPSRTTCGEEGWAMFPNTVSYIIVVLSEPGDSVRVTIAIYLPNSPFTVARPKCRVVEEAV